MTCGTCTASLEPGAAFCGLCGARVRGRRDSLTGAVLDGRFLIDAKIAAGGFGAIYRATYLPSGAPVALKVLHADLALDRNLAARFRREAAALACLRDEHTVRMYELGEAPDGTLFLAMELLTGHSLLDEFRAGGPLPWRRVATIVAGACHSLAEAHARGIVHRDLKPANIHLEQRGGERDFAKVLDFGIAKFLDGSECDDGAELTRIGQAIGTIEYMSPEQIVGGACDGRSDLYTLGVVAYEMITGRRPFADATGPTSLLTAVMTRAPAPLASLLRAERLPPELDAILQRCLARDPDARFASAGELGEAFARLLAVPERAAVVAPARREHRSISAERWLSQPDAEVTTLDEVPPVAALDPAWEPTAPAPIVEPGWVPAWIPQRVEPPPRSAFVELAQGSTVGPPPSAPAGQVQMRRIGWVRVAAWALALIASGIGIGAAIASLS
ncbi:MAG: protein kinase domain-containing protein [Kofleriaceae bacterium]